MSRVLGRVRASPTSMMTPSGRSNDPRGDQDRRRPARTGSPRRRAGSRRPSRAERIERTGTIAAGEGERPRAWPRGRGVGERLRRCRRSDLSANGQPVDSGYSTSIEVRDRERRRGPAAASADQRCGGGRRATSRATASAAQATGTTAAPSWTNAARVTQRDAGRGDEVGEQVLEALAPEEPAADGEVGDARRSRRTAPRHGARSPESTHEAAPDQERRVRDDEHRRRRPKVVAPDAHLVARGGDRGDEPEPGEHDERPRRRAGRRVSQPASWGAASTKAMTGQPAPGRKIAIVGRADEGHRDERRGSAAVGDAPTSGGATRAGDEPECGDLAGIEADRDAPPPRWP